jgi:hypothetical protein
VSLKQFDQDLAPWSSKTYIEQSVLHGLTLIQTDPFRRGHAEARNDGPPAISMLGSAVA